MASIRERMDLAGPLWKAMANRFDELVDAINELRSIVINGQNPHKVNDTTDVITSTGATDTDTCIDLAQEMITDYETHIQSTSYHLGADSANLVTELGVPKEIYAILNEVKADYNLHRVNTTTCHGGSGDTTNSVSTADADTKVKAIALANAIRTAYEAHRILTDGGVHGSADETNVIAVAALTSGSTWTEIAALADDLKAKYNVHHTYTTSSCHAGGGDSNTVTSTSVGTVTTAMYAGLNELKGDFDTHAAEFGTYHAVKDASVQTTVADATTAATAYALANELKTKINDHISRADSFAEITSLDEDA